MNNNKLQSRIMERLSVMPAKARRVAEYLLTCPSELAFLSIGEVAEKLNVSKAQLVRVAKMLDFDGYATLKEAVKSSVISQLAPSSLVKQEAGSDILSNICRLEHANIDETSINLSSEDITQFCRKVKDADVIYCVGWGISALIAENLYTRLLELGLRGVLMKRGSAALIEQVRAVNSSDLIVVCELPSYVIEVTESIKYAHNSGAQVITITDSPAAPVCQYADVQLHVSDSTATFGSSIVSAVYLIHVLTSILAFNLGEKVQAALKAQLEGLNDARVYHPAYGLKY
ncbi:MAG: MurR/RpiR family transcriptional regulator [Synergistaceae bacterium]|nr:MurR/RpiR family transcriptional regulator [Synergistaceae bacterium]